MTKKKTKEKKTEKLPPLPPVSICRCGHTGGALDSQHMNEVGAGHGICLMQDCPCEKFTFQDFGMNIKLSAWDLGFKRTLGSLNVPVRDVSEPEYPQSRYLGCVSIGNANMHVDVIQLEERKDGLTYAKDPKFESTLQGYMDINASSVPEVVLVDGRQYMVLIYPFEG